MCKRTHAHGCVQAHMMVKLTTFFFFLRGEGDGGAMLSDLSGVTFCPLLLGAWGRSSVPGRH